jgi:hypothetical protein
LKEDVSSCWTALRKREDIKSVKIDSSHIVKELPSETRYSRKEIGKDRSDGKTRKKT